MYQLSTASMRIEFTLFTGLVAALLLPAVVAIADGVAPTPQVGDTYEITLIRDSVEKSSSGSSGSSKDKDTIIEQVTGVRADGLELQYDLPNDATADDRARIWQFPARVFKPPRGPAQLLNSTELESRLDGWLKAAKLPRTACGHWVFTWSAFRIECDPQSVIKATQSYELGFEPIREGELYQDPAAATPGKLTRRSSGSGGESFGVEMAVDADSVRRARAESDVGVGEIMQKPVSLETALHERAGELVSGTISVAIETDPAGAIRRRTKVARLDTKYPDGHSETQIITETLERRRVSTRD